MHIAGLSAPVFITVDSYGVPRIVAKTEPDAAAALGYMHARERMFQMDLVRRSAEGRLAELAGPAAVKLDRMARILGEAQHAERAYAGLPDDVRALLVAYASGVNAWIAEKGRLAGPEFVALGAPEAWRPVDCLMWSETVSLWLSENFRTEMARAELAGKVSPALIASLWPPQGKTPAPDFSSRAAVPVKQGMLEALPAFPEAFTWPDEASNAWAVDGRHTATGAPLLAGDPHLRLGFPSIWYMARIETPGAELVGATAPGVPFLVIGHNAHVAWTFTSTSIDTQDVFVESELLGGMYATPDGPKPFATRREVIHVRGAADVVVNTRATRHGPVISDMDAKPGDPVLAVEMASLDQGSPAPGLVALNHAASVADAGRAAVLFAAPVQNLTVADHDGIALFTAGLVPVRKAGDGSAPVSGADGAHDWTGFASGDALPHYVAPASGIVVNANERTAPADFPVFLGTDDIAPWRARRIHALLDAKPVLGIGDFEAMQRDDVSVFAQDVLPALRDLPRSAGMVWQAQDMMRTWDGTMAMDRPEPLIFNATMQLFVVRALAAAHVPQADAGPWSGLAAWLLTPEGGKVWCGGDCRPALATAFAKATDGLAAKYGNDMAKWRWGAVHKAVFSHPLLGDLPVVGGLAKKTIAVPGDDSTLFRGGNGVLGDFTSVHGAAYRGIYDLADLERSRFVVTPGQSGNLLSPHAWDLLPRWAAGTTITIAHTPEMVRQTVQLLP